MGVRGTLFSSLFFPRKKRRSDQGGAFPGMRGPGAWTSAAVGKSIGPNPGPLGVWNVWTFRRLGGEGPTPHGGPVRIPRLKPVKLNQEKSG